MSRPERVLFELAREANGHTHRLTVIEVAFPDATEVYLELAEPDKCGCTRRLPLSEAAHLVLNLTDYELLVVPTRDVDQAGHVHG